MLDYSEYTTEATGYQGNGNGHHHNGYDKLTGNWLTYYKVATGFTRKVKPEDREDFLHDLFISFARVKSNYDIKGKELTTGGLVRIAQFAVANYWYKWFKQKRGTDCHDCNKAQKQKCKELDLYSQCPKAIKVNSLDRIIEDGNGDSTPFYEFIADDSIDLVAKVDARLLLKGYPRKAVKIAYKRYAGYPLDDREQSYLGSFRSRHQKNLVLV